MLVKYGIQNWYSYFVLIVNSDPCEYGIGSYCHVCAIVLLGHVLWGVYMTLENTC